MRFKWNRNPGGIKSQLDEYKKDKGFNSNCGEEFKRLNKALADKQNTNKFGRKLTAGKEYSSKATVMAKNRFSKMMEVIESKNKKGEKNDFFSSDNIRNVFLSFVENREKIEDSKNMKAEDRNKLVDDALSDNYKILAIYYFAGMLSAEDLDYFLRKLESIRDVLNKNTYPGWFEKFCFVVKTLFKSFVNRKVEKVGLATAAVYINSDSNRREKIIDSRHKSVFDKLRKTSVEIGAQNWNRNKTKAQNEINETNLR